MSKRTYVRGFSERGIGYDSEKGEFFIEVKPNPEAEAYCNSRLESLGDGRWKMRRSAAKLVGSFTKAIASGRADPVTIAKRKLSCFGDGATPACSALAQTNRGAFCKDCNCGQWPGARLDGDSFKITRAYLECPRKRSGFSNAVGDSQ